MHPKLGVFAFAHVCSGVSYGTALRQEPQALHQTLIKFGQAIESLQHMVNNEKLKLRAEKPSQWIF